MEDTILLNKIFKRLEGIERDIESIKEIALSEIPWVSAADVALEKGLKTQSVIKQLHNFSFEPEVDYKLIRNRMYIAKRAIFKIKRLRK